MNKKNKRKIRVLLLELLVTAIYLSTATYSWFSTNRIAYISDLHIKVKSQGSIEISADAVNFGTILTKEDIMQANNYYLDNKNQLPETMEPVSTGKEVDDGLLKMYYGMAEFIDDNFVLTAERSIELTDAKYIAFDLFLKTNEDVKLYLSNESGAFYQGNIPGIENSVRYAFLVEGNADSLTDYKTIQKLKGADSTTTYIWEPNYDVHTDNGVKHAKDEYGLSIKNDGENAIFYDGIVSIIKKSDKILLRQANADKYPNLFKKVDVDYLTPKSFENNIQIFDLKEGITKIRVYIWLEGQDVDCENNSAVGNIEFNFQFTTLPS